MVFGGTGAEGGLSLRRRRMGGPFEEVSPGQDFAPEKRWCCSTGAVLRGAKGDADTHTHVSFPWFTDEGLMGRKHGPDAGACLAATRQGADGAWGQHAPCGG